MSNGNSIFSLAFWKFSAEQAVHGAAGAVVTALAAAGVGGDNVPWYGVLTAAGIGGLTSLALSLSSQAVPGTLPASFIPAPAKSAAKKTAHKAAPHDPGRA